MSVEVLPAAYVADPKGYHLAVKARIQARVDEAVRKRMVRLEPPPIIIREIPPRIYLSATIYDKPIKIPTRLQIESHLELLNLRTRGGVMDDVPSIIRAVVDFHHVSYAEICGPRRQLHFVAARQLAVWAVCILRPDWSLPRIGRFFGGRDHTTIIHARNKIARLVEQGSIIIPPAISEMIERKNANMVVGLVV